MFKVTAIENSNDAIALCEAIGTPHTPDSVAYAAFDLGEDGESIVSPIAVCEFSFIGGCRIHCLAPMAGREEDEAVLILGFAVIDFFRKCNFDTLTANIPEKYALRLGFKKVGDVFSLDLKRPAGCGGH